MKIKTLTTYDVYNYGASLQAYALQTYLADLGNDVEIINYQPEYLRRKYDYKWVNPESRMSRFAATRCAYRIMKYLQRQTTLGRKRKFDEFNHNVLKETKHKYHIFEELYQNPPEADLYIVGSDQVWNVFFEAGRDPAFFLDFVKKGAKASYAASFSYLNIDNNNLERIKRSLSTFKAVSVREYQGLEILNKIGIKGMWVLDPVFLLTVEKWKELMADFKKTEPYLLVYDFEGSKFLKDFAKDYARRNGLKIYSITDTYPRLYADKNFNSAGPREFLSLIYYCDAFVSNSFHGTAFSIIFHKPVFVFNLHRHKVNSRMQSLIKLFQLEDSIITDDADYERAMNATFDFHAIDRIKDENLSASEFFLEEVVNNSFKN